MDREKERMRLSQYLGYFVFVFPFISFRASREVACQASCTHAPACCLLLLGLSQVLI